MPKNCSLFLMVLSRDLSYPAISITFSFDFFSVYDLPIIPLMYHISAASSLLSRSFVCVQHSHPCRRMDHYVDFQSVNFGVNSDISVGEEVLHRRCSQMCTDASYIAPKNANNYINVTDVHCWLFHMRINS